MHCRCPALLLDLHAFSRCEPCNHSCHPASSLSMVSLQSLPGGCAKMSMRYNRRANTQAGGRHMGMRALYVRPRSLNESLVPAGRGRAEMGRRCPVGGGTGAGTEAY